MWSRATVTTCLPQWRIAATAALMSTIFIIEPPWTLPIGLASFGSITWLMLLLEADIGLGARAAGSPNSRLWNVCVELVIYLFLLYPGFVARRLYILRSIVAFTPVLAPIPALSPAPG